MNILLIHQNFPGQFLRLAQQLAISGEHNIVGLGEGVQIKKRGTIQGMNTFGYTEPKGSSSSTHHYLRSTEAGIRRGQSVVRALVEIEKKGFYPDLICVHPGWGEGLFIRDYYPNKPIIMLAEFYFRAKEADLAFDPNKKISLDKEFSIDIKNTIQLLSLPKANVCVSPTYWQASRYPWYIKENIEVIHEGIDTEYMKAGEDFIVLEKTNNKGDSIVVVDDIKSENSSKASKSLMLTSKDKVVTFVSRNLEPYRGFDRFMYALPKIQKKHKDAHFVIVGGTSVSYSDAMPDGTSYKDKLISEMDKSIDWSHVHFVGKIPYSKLRALFRISSAHVYLTYPFVLSWSVLEAMSCEALIIASRTSPVEEVIFDNVNGVLVDYFSETELELAVSEALSKPEKFTKIKEEARKTIVDNYNLKDCLLKYTDLINRVYEGEFPYRP